jgi:hypothetical protein
LKGRIARSRERSPQAMTRTRHAPAGAICVLLVAGIAVPAAPVPAQAPAAGEPAWGTIALTQPVFDAWVASGRDSRIAKIYARAAPDPEADADLGALASKLKALATDPKLDALARLYGFTGARAWVEATLKVNSGILGALLVGARKDLEASPMDKNSAEYKATIEELDKELREWRAAWGSLTEDEQQVVSDSLEEVRLLLHGERPEARDALTLERLQRWIAAGKDERIRAALDGLRTRFAEGPAVLRELIARAAVDPDIDAAAREQGFAGAHQWADVTAKVVGATLERSADLRLTKLDESAAEHTPEQYEKLMDAGFESLATIRLAFGTRPQEDMDLIDKYFESIGRVLGVGTGGEARNAL